MIVYGRNPVLEALRGAGVREIRVAPRARERHEALLALARQHHIPVRTVPPDALDRECQGGVHQGICATVDDARDYSVEELVRMAAGPPLVVVVDGVEDPHNLGAIVRTVDGAGADGMIVQSRRSAARGGAAAKASAGAMAHVRIAEVVNIARALDELKALGVWTIGLAGEAEQPYDALDMTGPTALVLGAEGTGLRRLVRDSCDFLAKIPMHGHVASLNVSVAAGIVLFEAVRQRGGGPRRPT